MSEAGSYVGHDRTVGEARDKPVADLLRQLSEQTATLVRQELELVRAEIAQKGKAVGIGAGMFGAAGVLGLFALGAFTAFLILVLDTAMVTWLAALIVTVAYGAIAGALALTGKEKVQEGMPPVPEQATESVKEDVEWTMERAKAGRP